MMKKYLILSFLSATIINASNSIEYNQIVTDNNTQNIQKKFLKKKSMQYDSFYEKVDIVEEIQQIIHAFDAKYYTRPSMVGSLFSMFNSVITGSNSILSIIHQRFLPLGVISTAQTILHSSSVFIGFSAINLKRSDRIDCFIQNLINNNTEIKDDNFLSEEQITLLHTNIVKQIKEEYEFSTYSLKDIVKKIMPFINSLSSSLVSLLLTYMNNQNSYWNGDLQRLNLICSLITVPSFGYILIRDLLIADYLNTLDKELLQYLKQYQHEV